MGEWSLEGGCRRDPDGGLRGYGTWRGMAGASLKGD